MTYEQLEAIKATKPQGWTKLKLGEYFKEIDGELVTLKFERSSYYYVKNRLRIPSKTKYTWAIVLLAPGGQWGISTTVWYKSFTGENQFDKEKNNYAAGAKIAKKFGIDLDRYEWTWN